jgi:hypothetical protein
MVPSSDKERSAKIFSVSIGGRFSKKLSTALKIE